MRIAVIGAGYVGVTTGVAFASQGHDVVEVDHDTKKLERLSRGMVPFYEQGMEDVLHDLVTKEKLLFNSCLETAVDQSEIIFITVGTPSLQGGGVDLSYIDDVARNIAECLTEYKLVVIKSTVPVGTTDRVRKILEGILEHRGVEIEVDVVSNPEFLREGRALRDALSPERIVIGSKTERARKKMEQLYEKTDAPILYTSIEDAEMIKYASNAFLATKISFINELARVCEVADASIGMVAKGMGMDSRIGSQFLQAGIGYGGSCFPKDVKGLISVSASKGQPLSILQAVATVNETQPIWFLEKMERILGDLRNKRIAVLGLAFKPGTDDCREAVSLKVIEFLLEKAAIVFAYDPKASSLVQEIYPDVQYVSSPLEAMEDAHATILVTEWAEIIELNWEAAITVVQDPIIFDGRNALNPEKMSELGFQYYGVATGDHG